MYKKTIMTSPKQIHYIVWFTLSTILFFISTYIFAQEQTFSRETSKSQCNEPIYILDIRDLRSIDYSNPANIRRVWDDTLLITSLQGLVNRESAQLYLFYVQAFGYETDEYWLDVFSHEIPSADGKTTTEGWLQGRQVIKLSSINEAMELFSSYYKGIVVYDENAPSTVNVALAVAGAEDLLPVRYDSSPDSLFHYLVEDDNGPKLPICVSFVDKEGSSLFTGQGFIPDTEIPSTGSVKVDPYYWLIEKYIKTGVINPLEGGYYIDAYWLNHPVGAVQNNCITNRDFVISRKGFFFDLSPWDDETPNDDPNQEVGTDFKAFNAIMRAIYEQTQGKEIIRVSGFTPWDAKYTNYGELGGKHEGVPTEWRHAEILSNYNAYLDADALGCCAMANASFFQHFPLAEYYPQNKPSIDELYQRGYIDEKNQPVDKTFVAIYSGDYDSSAWLYQSMPAFWNDEARGSVILSWAFNPNLSDRFAPGLDYIRRTQTKFDYFVSGDSGAGYVNPTGFETPRKFSNLPDNLDIWIDHCNKYFKRWDLSGIGFIIDGFATDSSKSTLKRLSQFAPDGMVVQRGNKLGVVENTNGTQTPWLPMNFDISTPQQGRDVILGDVRMDRGVQFHIYRTILWSPSQFKELQNMVLQDKDRGSRVVFVDMYSLWLLIRLEAQRLNLDEFDRKL